jgi:hypothetical protein
MPALARVVAEVLDHGAAPTASYAGLIKTPGDVAPEVVSFIGGANPRLVVANEGSNTTTVYDIAPATPGTYTLQILHASDFEAGLAASTNAPRFAALLPRTLTGQHTAAPTALTPHRWDQRAPLTLRGILAWTLKQFWAALPPLTL